MATRLTQAALGMATLGVTLCLPVRTFAGTDAYGPPLPTESQWLEMTGTDGSLETELTPESLAEVPTDKGLKKKGVTSASSQSATAEAPAEPSVLEEIAVQTRQVFKTDGACLIALEDEAFTALPGASISTLFVADEPGAEPLTETEAESKTAPTATSAAPAVPSPPPKKEKSAANDAKEEVAAEASSPAPSAKMDAKEAEQISPSAAAEENSAPQTDSLAQIQQQLDQLQRQQKELITLNKKLAERIVENEARMGELLMGLDSPGDAGAERPATPMTGSTRSSMAPPVTLLISFPAQGPLAGTDLRFDAEGGIGLVCIGSGDQKLTVPNTGRLAYRVAGDANGYPRQLTWDAEKAANAKEYPIQLPLSLKQQER